MDATFITGLPSNVIGLVYAASLMLCALSVIPQLDTARGLANGMSLLVCGGPSVEYPSHWKEVMNPSIAGRVLWPARVLGDARAVPRGSVPPNFFRLPRRSQARILA